MKKYSIKESHIMEQGGMEKLKRDGYTRSDVMQKMYKVTEGASRDEVTKIVTELFRKE